MTKFAFSDIPDLSGQVAVITGAAGIGEQCGVQLALHGATVFLLARSKERYNQAFERFKANKDAGDAPSRWKFVQCDLADLESVEQAGKSVASQTDTLSILLNNAGVMGCPYGMTKQGLETQLGTNVVGHALLSFLLLPLLTSTAKKLEGTGHSVRCVQLSSAAHLTPFQSPPAQVWKDVESVNDKGSRFEFTAPWVRYGRSKTGNILLANELAKITKGQNITHISVHPGYVATELMRGPSQTMNKITLLFERALRYCFALTPDQGAITSLYAATSPEVDTKKLNGSYLVPYAQVSSKSAYAEDKSGEGGEALVNFVKDFCQEKVGVDIDGLIKQSTTA